MKKIKAPVEGYLLSIKVAEGDKVVKGQILAVILLLKMENPIQCDRDGVVKEILAKEKTRIKPGQVILCIE